MIPVGQNPSLVNPTILDYLDWSARGTTPALPIAGTLRFWIQNTNGISRLHYSDATGGDDIIITRDSLFIARNTSGVAMTDGQAVYVSGTTGQIPIVSLAKSDSITTLPCAGVVMGTIANNGFGYVHMLGIHSGINTNAFSAGDKLYVSASVAGGLTNVKPNAPWQFVGIVISKSASGVIYIRPNGPTEAHTVLDADEHSDTVAHVPVLGDVIFGNSTPKWDALAGNITTTRKFLRQVGTGVVSAAPAWDTILGSDITGAALTKTDDTNVTLTLGGSPTTALLNAASLTLGWTGTLAVSRGGLGVGTLGTNAVLTGNGTSAVNSSTDFTYDGTDVAIASGKRFRMQSQNRIRFLNSMASVTNSTNESINSSSVTVITFDTELFDTDAIHDNVTNNSRLTAKLTGKYLIGASAYWDVNTTGFRQIFLKLNNTTIFASQVVAPVTGSQTQQFITSIYPLSANDYIEVYAQQNSGSPLNIVAGSNGPSLWMVYLGE